MLIKFRNEGRFPEFRREVAVRLKEKCSECGAAALVYKVDFAYPSKDTLIYVEAKGAEVASFMRRKKAWVKSGPGDLQIFKGRYHKGVCVPYLAETVFPKSGA